MSTGVLRIKCNAHTHKHTHTHSLTLGGILTARRVVRPAKSVLALAHLAADDQGAVADRFLVRLVLVHFHV